MTKNHILYGIFHHSNFVTLLDIGFSARHKLLSNQIKPNSNGYIYICKTLSLHLRHIRTFFIENHKFHNHNMTPQVNLTDYRKTLHENFH